MEEAGEPLEDEFEEPLEDEDLDEGEEGGIVEPDALPPAIDGVEVESIEGLIAKKDGQRIPEEEDDPLLALGREERLEPLAVKVVPPQPTEFVCKKCFLVRHLSQLKDKKRMLCRDCA